VRHYVEVAFDAVIFDFGGLLEITPVSFYPLAVTGWASALTKSSS